MSVIGIYDTMGCDWGCKGQMTSDFSTAAMGPQFSKNLIEQINQRIALLPLMGVKTCDHLQKNQTNQSQLENHSKTELFKTLF